MSLGSPRKCSPGILLVGLVQFSVPTEGPNPPQPAQIRPAPDQGVADNLPPDSGTPRRTAPCTVGQNPSTPPRFLPI